MIYMIYIYVCFYISVAPPDHPRRARVVCVSCLRSRRWAGTTRESRGAEADLAPDATIAARSSSRRCERRRAIRAMGETLHYITLHDPRDGRDATLLPQGERRRARQWAWTPPMKRFSSIRIT